MLQQPTVPAYLIARVRRWEAKAKAARTAASEAGVKSIGLKEGQIVRDTDTGARYEIKSAYIWLRENDCQPQVSIMGVRVYKTGRRPARTTTVLTGRNFDLEV